MSEPLPGGGVLCANCGTAATDCYCARCGQALRGRLESRQLVGAALDQLFSLESRLGRTVVELSRNPGAVARSYVGGRRARYVNPFKYCLAMVAAYLLLGAMLGVDPRDRVTANLSRGGDPVAWVAEAQAFLRRNLNNVIFFSLPLFAAGLRLIYRRRGFNFAETYAFVLFVVGHIFLVGLVLTPLAILSPAAMLGLRMLFHVAFFTWAAMVFYDQRTFAGGVRAAAANGLYFLSIVPVAMAFLTFYAIALRG